MVSHKDLFETDATEFRKWLLIYIKQETFKCENTEIRVCCFGSNFHSFSRLQLYRECNSFVKFYRKTLYITMTRFPILFKNESF